jgi:hypothetical protein
MKNFVGAQWRSSHTRSPLIAANALIGIAAGVECLVIGLYGHYRIWRL